MPLLVHGVALGPASATPVNRRRLDALARLVERVNPESWSEHLASSGQEASKSVTSPAAPRTQSTVDAAANLARAAAVVGTRPLVENIATLMDAPCERVHGSGMGLRRHRCIWMRPVLDLHNLHANSVNWFDPMTTSTHWTPPHRRYLAGGWWIDAIDPDGGAPDDDGWTTTSDVPDPVYALLVEVGARPQASDRRARA